MANKLSPEKKTLAVSMLCEGNSIRSIERMTGIHRDTIMRLGVRVGEGCKELMDDKFHGLSCDRIEVESLFLLFVLVIALSITQTPSLMIWRLG